MTQMEQDAYMDIVVKTLWRRNGVAENMYQKSVDGFENIKDFIKTLDAAYIEVPEEEDDE